jgi:hypothetical protein
MEKSIFCFVLLSAAIFISGCTLKPEIIIKEEASVEERYGPALPGENLEFHRLLYASTIPYDELIGEIVIDIFPIKPRGWTTEQALKELDSYRNGLADYLLNHRGWQSGRLTHRQKRYYRYRHVAAITVYLRPRGGRLKAVAEIMAGRYRYQVLEKNEGRQAHFSRLHRQLEKVLYNCGWTLKEGIIPF